MLHGQHLRVPQFRQLHDAPLQSLQHKLAIRLGGPSLQHTLLEDENRRLLLGGLLVAAVDLPQQSRASARHVSGRLELPGDRIAGQNAGQLRQPVRRVLDGITDGVGDCVAKLVQNVHPVTRYSATSVAGESRTREEYRVERAPERRSD